MPKCTTDKFIFTKQKRREIEAFFDGGEITSDGGLLLPRELDRQLHLTSQSAAVFKDPRVPERIIHTRLSQLRQRVYALALGYEDLNDHQFLRRDIALQTAVERDSAEQRLSFFGAGAR